jgi:hypothetical protein
MGVVTIAPQNLIDDMEEGSGGIIQQGGRSGSWFTYNDGTDGGVQTPPAGGPCLPALIPDGGHCGSLHAMHTYGDGFTNYGVGIGFDLNHTAGTRMPYDVHTYTGIVFSGMGPQAVQVQIVEQATAPASQGGNCTGTCGDHFFLGVVFPAGWKQIKVPFSMLKQSGWGTMATWDPTTVLAVQIAVNPAPAFDYWIDDIGFY